MLGIAPDWKTASAAHFTFFRDPSIKTLSLGTIAGRYAVMVQNALESAYEEFGCALYKSPPPPSGLYW